MSEMFSETVESQLVGDARVLQQGLVSFPEEVLARLGVSDGARLKLVCKGDRVVVMNAAVYAMEKLQDRMEGEAERVGFGSVEDADAFIKEIRTERIR